MTALNTRPFGKANNHWSSPATFVVIGYIRKQEGAATESAYFSVVTAMSKRGEYRKDEYRKEGQWEVYMSFVSYG